MPNESDSNPPRTDTEFKLPPPRPTTPPAPLQRALADDGKRDTEDTKNKANELAREFRIAEKWVIGTNIALAIIGLGALCIYYGQLRVMQGQLGEIIKQFPEIQKSAQAARDSADRSRETLEDTMKNFRVDQRAWIGIVGIKRDHPEQVLYPTTFSWVYKNWGRSPATDVITTDNAHVYGERFPAYPFYEKRMPSPEMNSKSPVFPGQQNELDGSAYICQRDIDEIKAGKKWCYTYGFITYKDEFGLQHTTHFCYRHGVNPLGRGGVLCSTYNDAD